MPSFIPLRSDLAAFDLQVVLDGLTVTLDFRWNTRALAWWMTVLNDEADTVLVGNTRVTVDFPQNAYLTGREPPGLFIFVDTSGQGRDPGLTDLGNRVQLTYTSAEELAAL